MTGAAELPVELLRVLLKRMNFINIYLYIYSRVVCNYVKSTHYYGLTAVFTELFYATLHFVILDILF